MNAHCPISAGSRKAALVAAAVLHFSQSLMAADPPPAQTDPPVAEAQARDRKEARQMAGSIRLAEIVAGNRVETQITDQPVLRYGDTARNNEKGSVWIWRNGERPTAILELYKNTGGNQPWVFAISSLTTFPLEAEVGISSGWAPTKGGIEWQKFAGVQPPAERSPARVRQIRELAARFSAHEFWDPDNQRYELRLLPQSIYKYSDSDAGTLDGAVFLLTHGTNPEVVLLIEAVREKAEESNFRYALARLGHAEMHVNFDAGEVWTQPRLKNPGARDPYWLFFRPPLTLDDEE